MFPTQNTGITLEDEVRVKVETVEAERMPSLIFVYFNFSI